MWLAYRGVLIWFGAAAIVAGSVWLDLHFGCAFFQRGGSVLVAYVVFVGMIALRARADYAAELHAIQREQCQIAQAMYAEDHEAKSEARLRLRRQIEPRLKELDGRLARLEESGWRFQGLRVIEGPILMIGTAIWGFGDLLLNTAGCRI